MSTTQFHPRPAAQADRSLTDVLKTLRDQFISLLRQEVDLARTEMSEKASRAGRNIGYLAVGTLVAYSGALFLLLALQQLLALGLAAAGAQYHAQWFSALIVGAVVGLIGYALVQKAISTLKHESVMPAKTAQSLQENKQWIQERVT
jgi:hypothetical protein